MSDDGYDIGVSSPVDTNAAADWSSTSQRDDLAVAIEKEKIIKWVLHRDVEIYIQHRQLSLQLRDIMQTQEGLRALLTRIEDVTGDIKKVTEENATLQVYLDNMTKNTAMFAGQKHEKR